MFIPRHSWLVIESLLHIQSGQLILEQTKEKLAHSVIYDPRRAQQWFEKKARKHAKCGC